MKVVSYFSSFLAMNKDAKPTTLIARNYSLLVLEIRALLPILVGILIRSVSKLLFKKMNHYL